MVKGGMMAVKLIGLDLDGTTLRDDHTLSDYNRKAIEDAAERGILVAIATGRVFSALPSAVKDLKAIKYAVTSNGGRITDLGRDKTLFTSFIDAEAVEQALCLARAGDFSVEIFTDGKAYIDARSYLDFRDGKADYRNAEYIVNTRIPCEDIFDFTEKNKDRIENISFFFKTEEERKAYKPTADTVKNATVVSSLKNNIEIGGSETSKKVGLEFLARMRGIEPSEVMCIGDAPNDAPMIAFAGVGVAMGNAWDEAKAVADHITNTNENDGVGKAIRKWALEENDHRFFNF